MEIILQHLQEHDRIYIVLAICLLPPLVIFRRITMPIIQYLLECSIYVALMHFFVYIAVGFVAWFVDASSMKRAFDKDPTVSEAPDWNVPIREFWDRSLYNPEWLFYVECVVGILIIFLVWRYRPMKKVKGPIWKKDAKGKKLFPGNYQKQIGKRK